MKILKQYLLYVVEVMNPLFLQYGFTTLSMAQVGSSLEKKVAPEEVRLYPRAATSIGRSGGWLKGKLRILTLDT